MADKYTGKAQDRRYTGENVDIIYNAKRCIHAALCVSQLAEVFDKDRRPWILPDGTTANRVSEMIPSCPSGALHYERKDVAEVEMPPTANTITFWEGAPIQIHGNLSIEGANIDLHGETRATLCRCGASKNKPFCDNSHHDIDFDGTLPAPTTTVEANTAGGELKISVKPNGSLRVEGEFTIYDAEGQAIFSGDHANLCRCGGSARKPFCDGTHLANGFVGE